MVRVFKETLTRILDGNKNGKWWDLLQDVARGLRIIPVSATGHSPHLLVYKQPPPLPISIQLQPLTTIEIA